MNMKADEFFKHLQAQMSAVQQAYDEMAQAQTEFQGAYLRFSGEREQLVTSLVGARLGKLPPALQSRAETLMPDERKAVSDRQTALDAAVVAAQKKADDSAAAMQQKMAELRTANPQLNEREESLKAMIAFRAQSLHDLNAQVMKLGGGLGFLFRAGEIRKLDNERHNVAGQLTALSGELDGVRKGWQDLRGSAEAGMIVGQAEWAGLMAEVAAVRSDRDALAADPETLARRRACRRALEEMTDQHQAPAGDAELARLPTLNQQSADYQAALTAVNSMLAVLKGIHDGLDRFAASISALVDEQEKNSAYLNPLSLDFPAGAVALERLWPDLTPKVRDEKALATHPTDFVAAMRPYLDQRLTKEIIQAYFEAMGQSVTKATAAWK
jgi:hypothetical protein